MAYIGKQPTVGNFVKLDAITTSATTTFNLTNGGVAYSPQSPNHCIVSLNGVIQSPTSAYTISGSTIVFSDALTSSDTIDFILVLGDVLNIGTPSDATVTTAKLATDLTVTHALASATTPSITFTGDTNTGIFSPTADTIGFTKGGAEAMRINSSGQVGIGTTNPAERLHVAAPAGNGSVSTGIAITNSGNGSGTGSALYIGYNTTNGTYGSISGFYDGTGTSLTFGTSPSAGSSAVTERMRIDYGGNVGIGATSIGAKFHVRYDGNATIGQRLDDTYASAGTNKAIQFLRNASEVGTITMTTTATAYNTSSDYRLKENIVYDFDAITRLKLLKPARFNFIAEPNKTVDGFLAHEVQDIIPEAIVGTKDEVEIIGNITDADNNIIQENVTEPKELLENQTWTQTGIRPVYQGIDQAKLTPLLTKALQEAIAKIEQLEARLTTLENN